MSDRGKTERNAALARLCRCDVLSVEEERSLFGRLRAVREQELRQCRRNAAGAKCHISNEAAEIRNRIVESNLRLVLSLAKHFAAPERSLEDLVSDAALPLIRCVETFDPGRGTRFSTYATRALKNLFVKLRRQDYRRRSRLSGGDGWKRVVSSDSRPTTSDRLIQVEDLCRLDVRLAGLSPRERVLIDERFGLTGERRPRTFRELGVRHGLSKERVRVITTEAVSRLRESFDESQPP